MHLAIALLLTLGSALAQGPTAAALTDGQARLKGDATGSFKGSVVDPSTSQGLSDVPVLLLRPSLGAGRTWPEPWAPEAWEEEEDLATVQTAPDGSFRFDGLPDGAYQVRVESRWLPDVKADGYIESGGSIARTLNLSPGGRVSGRVVGVEGVPVGNIPVFVAGLDLGDGENAGQGRPASMPTRAAEDGSFDLRWIDPGVAWVQAGHNEIGYTEPLPIELTGGQQVADVVLRLIDQREELGGLDSTGRVGVRLDFTTLGPVIKGVIEGLPAARAGLQPGDLLASINGQSTRFMTSREFIRRCRGEPGTTVELTWIRGNQGPVDVVMTREVVQRRDGK
jgi:hypothetical protein